MEKPAHNPDNVTTEAPTKDDNDRKKNMNGCSGCKMDDETL